MGNVSPASRSASLRAATWLAATLLAASLPVVTLLAACAPAVVGTPRDEPVEAFASMEFERYGGAAGVLRLAEDAVRAEGWEVEADSTTAERVVTRPVAIPADGEHPAGTAVLIITATPRDDLTLVRVTAHARGTGGPPGSGDPRLVDAVQRVERRLHGRIGGGF